MLPRDGQMAPSPSQIHTAGDSADFCSLHAGQPLCRVDDVMVPPERKNRTSGFKKAYMPTISFGSLVIDL